MSNLILRLPLLRDPAVRRRLKYWPPVFHGRRALGRIRRAFYRQYGYAIFQRRLRAAATRRLVIGAWDSHDRGWIPTQQDYLDLLKPDHWARSFAPDSVDAMLAEHVWEHLTEAQGLEAARTCYRYLKPGGYLRVAVPDGLHPDRAYLDLVRPGAPDARQQGWGCQLHYEGNGANHLALYTYRSLQHTFESAGFRVVLFEYFDESGAFHGQPWELSRGTIRRSVRFHPRNRAGGVASAYPGTLDDYLRYTSIILDAVKD